MKRLLFFLLYLAIASPSWATTYYVSQASGSNANSCTNATNGTDQTKEKASIVAGIGCLSAGDTVQIRAGTYTEQVYRIIPDGTGFPVGATTVMAFPGDSPTLVGNLFQYDSFNVIWNGININGVNLPINGIPADQATPIFLNSSQHWLIENAEIYNAPCNNILTDDSGDFASNDITFHNIHSDHAGRNAPGTDPPGGHDLYISAHFFAIGALGVTVENSEFDHADAGANNWGIQTYSACDPMPCTPNLVQNVTIRNNYIHDNDNGMVIGSGGHDFVYNNIVTHNGFISGSYQEPAIDVAYNTVDNVQVFNNTVYNNAGYGIGSDFGSPITNVIVQNNILWQNGNSDSIPTIGTGSTITFNLQGINPKFSNGSGMLNIPSDFNITDPTSAAIGAGTCANAGTVFTTDYLGHTRTCPYDDGAYQFAATGLATVTTTSASSVTQTTFVSGANVTSDGGASVTEKGLAWATTVNPTTAGTHISCGTGTGPCSATATGLSAGVVYNYRAYAINGNGTSYGSGATVTTVPSTSSTFVRNSSSGTGTGTTASAVWPSGTVAGDLLVGIINTNSVINITDANGSTPLTNDLGPITPGPNSQTFEVWSRRIIAGDLSTWNLTLDSSQRWTFDLISYANPNASTKYDVIPSGHTNFGSTDTFTAGTASSITTITNGAIVTLACGNDGPSNVFTSTPATYSVQQNGGMQGLAVVTLTKATAGATSSQNFGWTSASQFECSSFAISPAGTTSVPSTVITSPSPGAVTGVVAVVATATSTNGATINQVEFFVDGVSIGIDNSSPYSMSFNSASYSVGSHTLTTVVTDSNLATAVSSGVVVSVSSAIVSAAHQGATWRKKAK